jgi:hypothetical protein
MTTLLRHFLLGIALLSVPAVRAQALVVEVPARLDPSAPITEATRRECDVPGLVGNHVLADLQTRIGMGVLPLQGTEPATGKVLRLTVVSARGVGGGGWSGPKSMTVRAEIAEAGKVLGGFTAHRGSRGGVWGGVSGTCAIFERIAIALGKDIGGWTHFALRSGNFARPPEPADDGALDTPPK